MDCGLGVVDCVFSGVHCVSLGHRPQIGRLQNLDGEVAGGADGDGEDAIRSGLPLEVQEVEGFRIHI